MLQGHHLSVMEAQTVDGFRHQATKFASSLGFRTVSALAVVDQTTTLSDFYEVSNSPAAYSDTYYDREINRVDPVMQHCERTSIPIMWDQLTYVESGQMWEHQAHYGYRTGVAMGLYLPEGRHFALGVDTDRPMASAVLRITRIVGELQLFAVHAQEAALRLLVPAPLATPEPTPRELEALRWTMDGKTAWGVGEALNISERTAVFHLQNAMRKLRCGSKYQAVLRAIRLGLFA